EGGRDVVAHLALHRTAQYGRLVLAGGQHQDLARLQDGGDAHGDGLTRHVLLAKEIGRGVAPGDAVEGDQPGARTGTGTRLVVADVTGLADAQDLQVDPARLADHPLVTGTLRGQVLARHVAARQVPA